MSWVLRPGRNALAVLVAGLLFVGCANTTQAPIEAPIQPPMPEAAAPSQTVAAVNRLTPVLESLAGSFGGRVGVAVEDVASGAVSSVDGDALYPQQSVSKLWMALTLLDQVDRGAISLSDTVVVRREDMSVFHQPIQAHLTDAGFRTTVDELLVGAIAQSDNAANDILLRRIGGPAAVQAFLSSRGVTGVRSSPEERVLQSGIAGLDWRPEYSFGQAFWTARDKVDPALRRARLDAYLADPADGATPRAMVNGLARLQRGQLLTSASTRRLLDILASTQTGPLRLKAGLPAGWSIAHKTGTGQDLGDLSTGFNDVGVLTAPNGRVYAVAVMIASTRRPIPERQALMAGIATAVAAFHNEVPRAPSQVGALSDPR